MDPISQGTVGAAFAQSAADKKNIGKISVGGFLAGLAPDLDVLIQSSTDPVLFLEYHRQFTHSLFFIPFGALIVAAPIFLLVRKHLSFKTTYAASFFGYATHGWVVFGIAVAGSHEKSDSRSRWQNTHNHLIY